MAGVWIDNDGRTWRVQSVKTKLSYGIKPNHAALRAFVFRRDGFRCRWCGSIPTSVPEGYDGRCSLYDSTGAYFAIDHVLSRRRGGTNHPDNLQMLCQRCNSEKVNRFDKVTCGTEA